jgi:hypothetical protein
MPSGVFVLTALFYSSVQYDHYEPQGGARSCFAYSRESRPPCSQVGRLPTKRCGKISSKCDRPIFITRTTIITCKISFPKAEPTTWWPLLVAGQRTTGAVLNSYRHLVANRSMVVVIVYASPFLVSCVAYFLTLSLHFPLVATSSRGCAFNLNFELPMLPSAARGPQCIICDV